MRALLRKDVQILRRSPLLVGLLVIYPIVIAVLIGFALSRGPEKPRVAFLNQVPSAQNTFSIGGEELDASKYANELFKSVEPVRVASRAEAIEKVRAGEALGALIVPGDITRKLQSGIERPTVEVIYNVEDPVKASYVESTIKARLADANAALSEKFGKIAVEYIGLLLSGGEFSLFGREFDVLGLERARTILNATIASLPRDSGDRRALEQVVRFAGLAIENLDLSDEVLASVGSPVRVKRTVLSGQRTPLDAFGVAVSVTVSLMLIAVLLAAGMLALEREEGAFGRLVRGLVSRGSLLAGKIALATACAALAGALMLGGIGLFISLDFSRAPLWLAALVGGGAGFAALGVAIGSLTREVRAASLAAVLLALPLAFLALVPSGAVSAGLYDVIRAVSAVFPFKPALQAMDAALNDSDPGLAQALAHLAVLTAGFGLLARLGLRRFA